ncbi:uncharacterized protein LOC100569586 isoform X1 [Acyrthosiphon pisum]|uniref:MBD domain-containing protein n=1 Tax=Acyrthosiphon pisum TaxID=7029 RepID=A0A8R2D4Z2_ACYPI|nr:uncharacterized protein LOC100569586 isoform X1 [Acyrthosiphon pisum]|eukprot:XP_016661773.1 PREDICTED: uncharacterized protein LOC100569586 [Acyrthosiphon pisum]
MHQCNLKLETVKNYSKRQLNMLKEQLLPINKCNCHSLKPVLQNVKKPINHEIIGFDVDDVLIIIDKKKKLVKMELSKETGEPIEVEDPSIVKNNHVNKKKQSKPIKPNDDKNNGSNKRRNKDNLRSDALELQVAPTSGLTTPTLNLTTSNTRKLYSMGRKIKVDISDAIYKLPFEHGWKRELVYRKSIKHSHKNRIFDVYYHSPAKKKLRSKREIQKQLDILSDKNLTIENFTFSPQPIAMNDRSKEFIRDANSKLFKEKITESGSM